MAAVLLLLLLAVLFLACLTRGAPVRQAALAAYTALAVLVLVVTEALSVFSALTPIWLALAWSAVLGLAAILLRGRVREGLLRLRRLEVRWDAWDVLFAGVVGAFVLGRLAAGILYPTMNYDSLTAHMPRVWFWAQNRSTAYYPTVDHSQLFYGSWAPYLVLQLKLLSGGGDRLAMLPQWLSYVFAPVAASLAAERLGATKRGAQAAALTAATIPLAVLQAPTTQLDLTSAFWSLTAAVAVAGFASLDADAPPRVRHGWAAWASAAAALAVLSKAPAYLVLAPFAVWAMLGAARRDGARRALAAVVLAAACFLALNGATYVRNAILFDGDVIGSSGPKMTRYLSSDLRPRTVVTMVLKNGAMLTATPSAAVNEAYVRVVAKAARAFGGDVDDPATRWFDITAPFSLPTSLSIRDHDTAPALVTVLLVVFSLVSALAVGRRSDPLLVAYAACGVAAFVLVAGFVTWNPYNNRILLGPLLVLVPIVGAAFTPIRGTASRLAAAGLAALLGVSVLFGITGLLFDYHSPLAPAPAWIGGSPSGPAYWQRSYAELKHVYSAESAEISASLEKAASANGIERIGIRQTARHRFPMYLFLTALPGREIRYVDTTLLPDKLTSPGFEPEAVIDIADAAEYEQRSADDRVKSGVLVPPVHLRVGHLDWVVTMYRAP